LIPAQILIGDGGLDHRPDLIAEHDADRRQYSRPPGTTQASWSGAPRLAQKLPPRSSLAWKSRISVMVGLILDSLIT
jgi:hypothetical protein